MATCHFHDTRESIQPAPQFRRDRQQDWSVGQVVKIGFVQGYLVTDFDGREYELTRSGKLYRGRPHRGVRLVGGIN